MNARAGMVLVLGLALAGCTAAPAREAAAPNAAKALPTIVSLNPCTDAILQAGRDRLRPILMTTLTTLLGMLPLAVGDAQIGGGGEGPAYHPMARAIMGGLGFSALVSLLIVPMFYIWFDDLNEWRRRVFGRSEAGSDQAPEGALPVQRSSTL